MLWDILIIIVSCIALVVMLSKNKTKSNPPAQQVQYTPAHNPAGRFCPYCGREIESSVHQFCPGCGNKL
ncbi:MAG: zinc-ribbon domain-containing protein [Clostridia bacterium]|nr:zinc-ribbon domain-containing protein [Clostridia bacterium]